ncbi:uncharacterized protein LOC135844941 [Planococcus citri]|uniref:uncharacterized protein LOC135844941 n=1 Tax=Planococcus citri TaxID=170843 RepID=UPI0031F94B14
MSEANTSAADDEAMVICTPPDLRDRAQIVKDSSLPKKSKKRYELTYNMFLKWQSEHQVDESLCSEDVLLVYFEEQAKIKSPNTLWSMYSMLHKMIFLKQKKDISKYVHLDDFLKSNSKGYKPKKAKIFRDEEISKFIETAPDECYLAVKVILIFGILGACRSDEMVNMTTENIVRFESPQKMYLVSIPEENKTNISRSFTITDSKYFDIVERYLNLRPKDLPSGRLFVTYQGGRCIRQFIGKTKISAAAKEIASFLELEPALYTGHSFRRSSATLLADSGADMLAIQRLGGWKSMTVASGYADNSMHQKKRIEALIESRITPTTKKFTYKKPSHPSVLSQPSPTPSTSHELEDTRIQQPDKSQYIIEDIQGDVFNIENVQVLSQIVQNESTLPISTDSGALPNIANSNTSMLPIAENSSTPFIFQNCSITINMK